MHSPLKKGNPQKKNLNQWITPAIKVSIKLKNRLYIIYKNRPSLFNETKYKTYKNKLHSIIDKAKKMYYEQLFDCNKNNAKKTWEVIKSLIGKRKVGAISDDVIVNDMITSDKQEKADAFNDYFINVGPDLASKITHTDIDPLSFMGDPNPNTIYMNPVTPHEISLILTSLKKSSPGVDGIHPKIIPPLSEIISVPLAHIFNSCLEQSVVPSEIKIARVTPVPKSGDLRLLQNYRPISVLPVFAKVFEKLVYNRIYNFLNQNNIFNSNQFGFRKGFSTEMAIATTVETITNALDRGDNVIGVLLDLKKAFDTVNFEVLFKKLNHIGIRGNALKLLKSYLTNRQQSVGIEDIKSSFKQIKCGVPQGSNLGPLLFLIYINDLPNTLNSSFPIMYADDTNIFSAGSNINEIENNLNRDLASLELWLRANKLTLNLNKTYSIFFTLNNSNKTYKPTVKINNVILECVTTTNFLGVRIDQDLSWSSHISHVANKISKSIGILKKIAKYVNNSTLRLLYFSFIHPYFNYCLLIWGNAAQVHMNRLFLLQKRAIRIISRSHFLAHTSVLFLSLNVLKIADLFYFRCSIFSYKLYNNQLPTSFLNVFKLNTISHSHVTRALALSSLNIPFCRTVLKQKSLKTTLAKLYNSFLIPNSLNTMNSIFLVKKFTLNYLLNRY